MSKPEDQRRVAEARERVAMSIESLDSAAMPTKSEVFVVCGHEAAQLRDALRLLLSELDRVTGERDEARADAKLCADSWVKEIESNNARRDDLKAVWDMLNRYDAPTLDDGDGEPLSLANRVEAMVYRDAARALAAEADRDRMREERDEAQRRAATYAELLLPALKALESAQAWIRDTVRGAKAQDATIDIIATDARPDITGFWTRTKRVQGNIRSVLRKSRAALTQEDDHGR